MATNSILRFGENSINILSQSEYQDDLQRLIGHQPGPARSTLENKVLKQVSAIAVGVAEFMADNQPNNITDGLSPQSIAGYLSDSIKNTTFPSGTRLVFAQAAAPTGWVQVNNEDSNNRMLRVVSGPGGGTNGIHSPILNNVVPSHTHGFTTGFESSSHTHTASASGQSSDHTHSIATPARQYGGDSDRGSNFSLWSIDNVIEYGTNPTSNDHTHVITVANNTQSHTHSGSTDNGSSQTSWQPRYIDLILCVKS